MAPGSPGAGRKGTASPSQTGAWASVPLGSTKRYCGFWRGGGRERAVPKCSFGWKGISERRLEPRKVKDCRDRRKGVSQGGRGSGGRRRGVDRRGFQGRPLSPLPGVPLQASHLCGPLVARWDQNRLFGVALCEPRRSSKLHWSVSIQESPRGPGTIPTSGEGSPRSRSVPTTAGTGKNIPGCCHPPSQQTETRG